MVAEAAKSAGLPYARFSAVYAESQIGYGGEMTGTPSANLRMQPVWVTIGDYGNLLGARVIMHMGEQNPKRLAELPLRYGGAPYLEAAKRT